MLRYLTLVVEAERGCCTKEMKGCMGAEQETVHLVRKQKMMLHASVLMLHAAKCVQCGSRRTCLTGVCSASERARQSKTCTQLRTFLGLFFLAFKAPLCRGVVAATGPTASVRWGLSVGRHVNMFLCAVLRYG